MQRIILVVLAALVLSPDASWAVRVLEQLESSYELGLNAVDLPQSAAGAVVFKACATCTAQSMAVNASTRYFTGRQQVTLGELNQVAARLEQSATGGDDALVMVHYDIDTKVVTRIRISSSTLQ